MDITTDAIKKLRERTGAGMMDCKRALESTGGDMEKAIDYLRKKGAAVGAKRADRSAKEGVIVTRVSPDAKSGVILEVNCETDFVGRSEDFVKFAGIVAAVVQQQKPSTVEQLIGLRAEGRTVAELLNDMLAKVGEKIEIRRFNIAESPDGTLSVYTHLGSKIGVLVELSGISAAEAATGVGRDIAMQIAAMNPSVIARDQLGKSLIDREMEVYKTQAKNEGKPDHILGKIATGRLEKFYQEICLVEQTFIKDGGKTVKEYLREASAKSGRPVAVRKFYRYHLGEEVK
jgi:elongation factor Ts